MGLLYQNTSKPHEALTAGGVEALFSGSTIPRTARYWFFFEKKKVLFFFKKKSEKEFKRFKALEAIPVFAFIGR